MARYQLKNGSKKRKFGAVRHKPQQPGKPVQRNAANARERARMRVLSHAFGRLKTSLPWVPRDTKLSKLDTLRLASTYIAHLRQILGEEKAPKLTKVSHPVMTWPFSFQSKPPDALGERRSNDKTDHSSNTDFVDFRSCQFSCKQTNEISLCQEIGLHQANKSISNQYILR